MNREVFAKSVFTGTPLRIHFNDAIVSSIDILDIKDANEFPYIAPGIFDIQINGYVGKEYSAALSTDEILYLIEHLAKSGTTQHLATIITNSEQQIISSIRTIVKARKSSNLVANAIEGFHIEGPFISPLEGSRGAHNPAHIRSCDFEEFKRWQEAAEGNIKFVTVSPEDDKALDFIRKVSATGVVVGLGHTAVSPNQIDKAVDAGASISTHLGNGSQAMLPRLENSIWKQLSENKLKASMIADGFHLPPYVLDCFTRCKTLENIILISDAAALAGSKPGLYDWGKIQVKVHDDGHLGVNGTPFLAGAAVLLDTCIANLAEMTTFSLADSMRCATLNPRKLFAKKTWDSIPKLGDIADFCLFTYREGSGKLSVRRTVLGPYTLFED